MVGDIVPGRAVPDGGINIAVRVGSQKVPNGRAAGVFKGDFAAGASGVEKKWDDGGLADVLGDVVLGVIGAHFLLVDVLFEDVAENLRIDFLLVFGSAGSAGGIERPIVFVEVIEDALERAVGDFYFGAVAGFGFERVDVKNAAIEIRDAAKQLVQPRFAGRALAESFLEKAQKEMAVERVELVLAALLLPKVDAVGEILGIPDQ